MGGLILLMPCTISLVEQSSYTILYSSAPTLLCLMLLLTFALSKPKAFLLYPLSDRMDAPPDS